MNNSKEDEGLRLETTATLIQVAGHLAMVNKAEAPADLIELREKAIRYLNKLLDRELGPVSEGTREGRH